MENTPYPNMGLLIPGNWNHFQVESNGKSGPGRPKFYFQLPDNMAHSQNIAL